MNKNPLALCNYVPLGKLTQFAIFSFSSDGLLPVLLGTHHQAVGSLWQRASQHER
jgi:hypothetical protein